MQRREGPGGLEILTFNGQKVRERSPQLLKVPSLLKIL